MATENNNNRSSESKLKTAINSSEPDNPLDANGEKAEAEVRPHPAYREALLHMQITSPNKTTDI